jgi:hypothetical protein
MNKSKFRQKRFGQLANMYVLISWILTTFERVSSLDNITTLVVVSQAVEHLLGKSNMRKLCETITNGLA